MFPVNARNCNSVQWQTQLILHRSLSHTLNFLPLQPLIYKISVWVCTGPLQSGSCSGGHSAAEHNLRPGKSPQSVKTCCFREPSKVPPQQGCHTWLVQEQAPSLRNRQRVHDSFDKNTPVERNGQFICIHSQWGAVQPLLLLCITHPGSDHRQGTNWIIKSQKLSQPVHFWSQENIQFREFPQPPWSSVYDWLI